MKKSTGSTQFNCFSPPVMLATLFVEFSLAIYTLWRYKLSSVAKLIGTLLVMLGTFQLAEYFVCTGYGISAEQWSRVGFAAITTLPPLGLHLLHMAADKPGRKVVYASYFTMTAFIAFFLSYHMAFIGHQCTGNYVIFQIGRTMAIVYGLYYYSLLTIAGFLALRWVRELKIKGLKKTKRLESVRALIVGNLVFLIPTAIANTVRPETRAGIPSIMCGFAVLYSLILALYVAPRLLAQKETALGSEKIA